MGYFNCQLIIDNKGFTCTEMEDGYYHIVVKVAEVNRINSAWGQTGFHDSVEFIYFSDQYTTTTGKIDNIVVTTK